MPTILFGNLMATKLKIIPDGEMNDRHPRWYQKVTRRSSPVMMKSVQQRKWPPAPSGRFGKNPECKTIAVRDLWPPEWQKSTDEFFTTFRMLSAII
jgi:hypothetical protein